MMDPWEMVYARSSDVVSRNIAGEMLLVPVRRHVTDLEELFVLDEMGAEIYSKFDGVTALGRIRDGLQDQYEVEKETLEQDLLALIQQLLGIGAIVPISEVPGPPG